MVSQARVMMGGIATVVVVSLAVWVWPKQQHGTVEIKQLDTPSWTVQITELGAVEEQTATTAR
jgi:hypothetical protein